MFRPADLDPDAVVLTLLVESGARVVHMMADHPHGENDDAPPEIRASLEGPGWTAEFVGTELSRCLNRRGTSPTRCLSASLPEAAGAGRYRLRGRTPLGSFTGAMTVPAMPNLEKPADTLWLSLPETPGIVPVPLDYEVDSATAALFLDYNETHDGHDLSGTLFRELGDTLGIYYDGSPVTIDLRLRGIGRNYAGWFRHTGGELVLPPWPSFGIEGEGVYGYFDGISAPTRWVHIVGEP